jgi:hypothetical protein
VLARLVGSPLPPLAAPPRTRECHSPGNGVNSSGQAVTSLLLATELGSHALAAHYGIQLQQANWNRLREGWQGPVAWSTWSLSNPQGRTWAGVLLAAELPGAADRRLVYLRVDPAPGG